MAEPPIDEKEVFNRARQIEAPEERLAYLRGACGQDQAALERVQALLRVYDQEKSFLEAPAAGRPAPPAGPPAAGRGAASAPRPGDR